MMGEHTNGRALLASAHAAAWDSAVQRVADTKAALDQFHDSQMAPVNKAFAEGGASKEQVSETEDAWFVYVMVHHNAVRDLVGTRAQTLAAVTYKIETAHADSVFDGGYADEAIKAVLADLRGLSENVGSPP